MECNNCKTIIIDNNVKFCPECGYMFDERNKTVIDESGDLDLILTQEGLSFQESLRDKPLVTCITEKDAEYFLVKQLNEKYINIYNTLKDKLPCYLPSLHKNKGQYYTFNWNGMWQKLSEWISASAATDLIFSVWYKIVKFVGICHANGIVVNNFNPDHIWIDENNNPIFECLEFFSNKDEKNIVIYNEGFSSPEVKGGAWESVGFQSDIYCLGRLFIYLYKSFTKKEMIEIKEISPIIKNLPLNFGFAVLKALSEDVEGRWKNIDELLSRISEKRSQHISIFGVSEIGFREANEDSIYYSQKRVQSFDSSYNVSLMMVADGMGGLDCGEVASSFAIKYLSGSLDKRITEFLLDMDRNVSDDKLIIMLTESIEECNLKLVEEREHISKKFGTTIVVCVLIDNTLYMGYVGDSRLYVFDEKGIIKYVTEDHSLVGKREAEGDLTEEEAMIDPNKNIIYQALGLKKTIRVDTKIMKLEMGDIILLSSDGICGSFLRRELESLFSDIESIENTAVKLCYEAFERGSTDNCSLILAQLLKEGDCNGKQIFNT